MKKRNVPQNKKTAARVPRREGDPIPWRYCFLTLVCGAILVGGFFLAARQHFTAIDYGIENAKLRQQRENLKSEQQRFKLQKEIALSPNVIRKAAQKIGLKEMTASNIDVSSRKPEDKPKTDSAVRTPTESANKETAKNENRDEKKIAKAAKEETKKAETKIDKKKESAR
ncbi:MAG TPA: hypothetical protein VF721_19615 [Pyrinomonadaceae bacterium]|jgi:hypothetical protein